MTNRRSRMAISALAALLIAAFAPTAAHSFASTPCITNGQKYATSSLSVSTCSTTPVNVKEAAVNFVQGGREPNCVIVSFAAAAAVPVGEGMSIQAVLDNGVTCNPGLIGFSATPDFTARTMNFVCVVVQPGRHTLRMQFKSSNGGHVFLDRRTLIVQYVR